MKWKVAFPSPILAVIILHLCRCSCSIQATHPDLLSLCPPCNMRHQHKHACGPLIQFCRHPWIPSKSWKICFISRVFHCFLLNESAPVNCECSFGYTWQVEHFVQQMGTTAPPSPPPKLRKYRQPGHRNSVTSYWAPKSVGNPTAQYYSP